MRISRDAGDLVRDLRQVGLVGYGPGVEVDRVDLLLRGVGHVGGVVLHVQRRPRRLPLVRLRPRIEDVDGAAHRLAVRVDHVHGAVGAEDECLTVRGAPERAERVAGAQVDEGELSGGGVGQRDPFGALEFGVGVGLVIAQQYR